MKMETLKRFAATAPLWGSVFATLWWLYLEHKEKQEMEFERQCELERLERQTACIHEHMNMWNTLIK